MITLHWRQAGDTREMAHHDRWVLQITRAPDYASRYPAMVYSYSAEAWRGSVRTDIGTHNDSKIAREKCAAFINAKTTEGVTT